MESIKFSSNYSKLHNQKSARLVSVDTIIINEDTPQELVVYDALKEDGSFYPIPEGEYLQLVFIGNEFKIPFSTLRKDKGAYKGFASKLDYYLNHLGESFNLVILKGVED